MKKLIFFLIIFLALLGCREDVVEFSLEQSTATVFVNSFPRDADIFLNNNSTGKQTPDSLKYLDPGSYLITLKLAGYRDSSITVTVKAADRPNVFVSLKSE